MRVRMSRAVPVVYVPLYTPAKCYAEPPEKPDDPFPVGRYNAVTIGTRYGLHAYVYVWEGINPDNAIDELMAGYMRPEIKDPYGY